MRVLDMRLTVFITMILLTAAMPANCAEDPAAWFGSVTEQGIAAQARHESPRQVDREYRHLPLATQPVREAIQRPVAGRTFAHILRDFNSEAPRSFAVDQVPDDTRRALAASAH